MKVTPLRSLVPLGVFCLGNIVLSAQPLPDQAPRTWVLAQQVTAFQDYCLSGDGSDLYARIKSDFDHHWLDFPFPEEPAKYGDPDPRKRTSAKADLWREAQDTCGRVSSVAATAALLWKVTGDVRYLNKSREFLLKVAEWESEGATGVGYNDEAHFRLWRKLPMAYDQIRNKLTEAERSQILGSFAQRGQQSVAWIKEHRTAELKPNSLEIKPSSHPVRFMAMTGMSGLALLDDIPEARDWFDFAYSWYQDSFTPWGGDDGGWAEGVAYWRGLYEHAVFQDALFEIGDSTAYNSPFWKNTGYFQIYFVQPWRATQFGDLSNAGKFNIEPSVKYFMEHLARVTQNGDYKSWAQLYDDSRDLPTKKGLTTIDRNYPTTTEYLIRDFIASRLPEIEASPLSELPQSRYFKDIGWVSMHSALGQPDADIQLSFKSSPYGSYSHSHGDQNAFILNAWGKDLAINSGYREFHRSPHHKYYTRQTKSKNALLIDLRGQDVQNEDAAGAITLYETGERYTRAIGEAAPAYQLLQPRIKIDSAEREIVFIDQRYFVIRDHVQTAKPVMLTWLLHALHPMQVESTSNRILIENDSVYLAIQIASSQTEFRFRQWHKFPIPVDPKYTDPAHPEFPSYLLDPNTEQSHLAADTTSYGDDLTLYSVLWPTKDSDDLESISIQIEGEQVQIVRPDGQTDRINFKKGHFEVD